MHNKKHKAEISAQVLVYALTLIVVSAILILGYKYIAQLKQTQESSLFLIFRNNLRNDIAIIKDDFGTAKIKEYSLPEGADEICFVDKNKNNPLLCRGCPKSTDYRLIVDSIAGNSTRNVFLLDESSIKNTFSLDSVKIGCCAFKCFKAKNDKLKIMLEGDGKLALISQK